MVWASGVQVSGMCVIAGCGGEVVCKGLCRSHYNRQYYSGNARKLRMSRACLQCGRFFETERKDRKFCAARCRVVWWRRAKSSRQGHCSYPLEIVSMRSRTIWTVPVHARQWGAATRVT